ncbi:hypothetical protein [Methylomonas sp. CM2]|uniref:hypothetical protein n=1 Tax=Methylomonas sp. CM2 TaxID=3417647 RepID=UPI003CF91134
MIDPNRITATACQLAQANGINNPGMVDQLIGMMTRKIADGMTHQQAYEICRTEAKQLSKQQQSDSAIDQLIARIQTLDSMMTSEQVLS